MSETLYETVLLYYIENSESIDITEFKAKLTLDIYSELDFYCNNHGYSAVIHSLKNKKYQLSDYFLKEIHIDDLEEIIPEIFKKLIKLSAEFESIKYLLNKHPIYNHGYSNIVAKYNRVDVIEFLHSQRKLETNLGKKNEKIMSSIHIPNSNRI